MTFHEDLAQVVHRESDSHPVQVVRCQLGFPACLGLRFRIEEAGVVVGVVSQYDVFLFFQFVIVPVHHYHPRGAEARCRGAPFIFRLSSRWLRCDCHPAFSRRGFSHAIRRVLVFTRW